MKIVLPTIRIQDLTEQELRIYENLDAVPFGVDLCKLVAHKLFVTAPHTTEGDQYSHGLRHSHRDYCGIGIYFSNSQYTIGEVYDGMGPYPIIATFDSSEEFIQWLASQSDQSMSLFTSTSFHNQTITKLRLNYYLEDDYSPSWNSYAAYLRANSSE